MCKCLILLLDTTINYITNKKQSWCYFVRMKWVYIGVHNILRQKLNLTEVDVAVICWPDSGQIFVIPKILTLDTISLIRLFKPI